MACSSSSSSSSSSSFKVENLVFDTKTLSSFILSPNEKYIVYGVSELNEKGLSKQNLFLLDSSCSPKQLTFCNFGEYNRAVAFSPDSKTLLFFSNRIASLGNALYVLSLDQPGEARLLRLFSKQNKVLSIGGPVYWQNDTITFTMSLVSGSVLSERIQSTLHLLGEKSESTSSAKVYDHLPVRQWDEWLDHQLHRHIFAVKVNKAMEVVENSLVDVMGGNYLFDCPVGAFQCGGYALSPCGKQVTFISQESIKTPSDLAWTQSYRVYFASTTNHGEKPQPIPNLPHAPHHTPSYSPDGSKMAWLFSREEKYESDRLRLAVYDFEAKSYQVYTESWCEQSIGEFVWTSQNDQFLFSSTHHARTALFSFSLKDGIDAKPTLFYQYDQKAAAATQSIDAKPVGVIRCLHYARTSGKLFYIGNNAMRPNDIYSVSDIANLSEKSTRLTNVNHDVVFFSDAHIMASNFAAPIDFYFKGAGDDQVHALVFKPPHVSTNDKIPVLVQIHGGPEGSWQDVFHPRWNYQAFVAQGYALICINFHGSNGYGEKFQTSIKNNWGSLPFQDILLGVDAALESFSWMDEKRVAAMGASYGGYQINWIAGNAPDRFRCLINHDGIFSNLTMGLYTEELFFPQWEFGGSLLDAKENYVKHSPCQHIEKWKTPMLVISGSNDFRVLESEALQTFSVLQMKNIPSRLLIFPDENHWVQKPFNRVKWHQEVFNWLKKFI